MLIFLILKKDNFWKKSNLTILFTSINFSSLHFFFLHFFSSFRLLEPKISASNGGEEDICFVFRIVHVLYMLVKHVVDIQMLILQGKWENLAILSLIYENMGYRERSIWSQERMIGFVGRLLLGSWTENEFKKRTRVTHNIFRFLFEMLGPYLKKEVLNLGLWCRCKIR